MATLTHLNLIATKKKQFFLPKGVLHYSLYAEYTVWTILLLSLGILQCFILVISVHIELGVK